MQPFGRGTFNTDSSLGSRQSGTTCSDLSEGSADRSESYLLAAGIFI